MRKPIRSVREGGYVWDSEGNKYEVVKVNFDTIVLAFHYPDGEDHMTYGYLDFMEYFTLSPPEAIADGSANGEG